MSKEMLGVIAVAAIAAVYFYYRGRPALRGYRFRDVVKNPALWRRMIQQSQDVDMDIAAAAEWDNERVAREVQAYVFGARTESEAWREKKILDSLGPRVQPPVLAILRDESVRERLVTVNSEDLGPQAPFNRACSLLEEYAPAAAIAALEPFARHPDTRIRMEIGLVVGAIGTPETVPLLRTVLADADDTVRVRALIGLRRAEKAGRLDWRSKEALFPDLQQMISRDHNSSDAAKLLVDFDPEAATAFFLLPAIFRADAPALNACLTALAERAVRVPRERLMPLPAAAITKMTEISTHHAG